MGASVKWSGLDEFIAELRNLPADLAADGSAIVTDTAEEARDAIVAAYPHRTGNLKKDVRLTVRTAGRFGAAVVVRSAAKHAHIFEIGTQARHNKLGANRGSMPAGNIFVPIAIRKRRLMYERLKRMMQDKGLSVSGEP